MKSFKVGTLRVWILVLMIMAVSSKSFSQKFQLSADYIQGVKYGNERENFKGGTAISIDYLFGKRFLNFRAGIDFRTVQWGNQVSLYLDFSKNVFKRVEVYGVIQNGMALFRESPLYVFAGGVGVSFSFLNMKKLKMGVSVETRYSICPAYSKYSPVNNVIEIPLGIFIGF